MAMFLCVSPAAQTQVATPESRPLLAFDAQTQRRIQLLAREPHRVIDEARELLAVATDAVRRALLHYTLSQAYYTLATADDALREADAGLRLIDETTQPWLFHHLLLARANALDIHGQAELGVPLAQRTVRWATQHQHFDLSVDARATLGLLQLTLGNYDSALEALQESYALAQARESATAPEHIASLIALVFEYRGEDALSIPYFEESLAYYREVDDQINVSNSLYGLGRALRNEGQVERGLALLEESAVISERLDDLQGLAYTHKELAETYLLRQDYARAETYFLRALDAFAEAGNPYMQFGALLGLARVALGTSRLDIASNYVDRASTFITGESMQAHRIELDKIASQVMFAQANYADAYELLLKSYTANEEFLRKQNSERLLALKTEFEVAQKDAENARLLQQNQLQRQQLAVAEQRRWFVLVLIGLLLLICALLLVLYRNGLRHRQRLQLLADRDSLTGLCSRGHTLERLSQQVDLANRHGTPVSVAMIDLDHFKQINDRFGHQTGDRVLSAFGELARNMFRHTDVIGRIGGEEFLFAFPHTRRRDAEEQLGQFRQQLREVPAALARPDLNLTVSVGLVAHRQGMDTSGVIASADEALYQAKRNGRDQIVALDCPSI
jgi:diguanylate cyclase (GGDEF)-like protein